MLALEVDYLHDWIGDGFVKITVCSSDFNKNYTLEFQQQHGGRHDFAKPIADPNIHYRMLLKQGSIEVNLCVSAKQMQISQMSVI